MLLTQQHPAASLQAGSQVKPRAIATPSATSIRSDAHWEVRRSIGDMQATGNHIRLGEIRNANSRLRGLLATSQCRNTRYRQGPTRSAQAAYRQLPSLSMPSPGAWNWRYSLTALADDIGGRLLSVMPYLGPWSLMAVHVVVPTFSCTLANTRHAWLS